VDLVSVLVPCRDAAPWLAQALRSALDQTWRRLEVIVVDDGSVDGSFELARRFSSSRCRVVRQDRCGASSARNHALCLAQGGMIQYLDADDFLAPDKIELQLDAMHHRESGCLSWGSAAYRCGNAKTGPLQFETARAAGASATDFLARLWGGGEPGMVLVHQWLTPRALIEHAGPWNEKLSVDDDGEFFTRVLLASTERIPVPAAHCSYRKFHSRGNLSARVTRSPSHRRSALDAACLKAGHLLALVPHDPAARRAVSKLVTQQIVDVYPDPTYLRGFEFLKRHDIAFFPEFDAPPWFLRARPLIGWKAARRLQDCARGWRQTVQGAP
jgi:glycosyltransferase involved in cell wall biosynthesis